VTQVLPVLWAAAIALKVLVWLSGPDQLLLDRAINLVFLVLAGISILRITRQVRSALLWRVSRKLILSYILIGAVPILLLVTFSLLAFFLIFFDVSSYLVQSRVATLTRQAGTFAKTTAFEIERAPAAQWGEIVRRSEAEAAAEYPGSSVSASSSTQLPAWLRGQEFSGLVSREGSLRAIAVQPAGREGSSAVVVELPIERALAEAELAPAGIHLGDRAAPYAMKTATYFTHREWHTGGAGRTPLSMGLDVAALYRFLGRSQGEGSAVNVNQLLLYALVAIGVLLLVIEMVALGSGLALARSITAAVDELFTGTERVKGGDFRRPIAVRSDDQLGQLAASFNEMTGRIEVLLREQDEKRRLAEELRIARDIQMSLLPNGPLSAEGLSVAAMCAPAREVGGDYYDLLPLPDGRVALVIADVSGKGMSAALYMAELKGLMLSLSRMHTSPRTLLIEANRIIARHLDSRSFITMTYAVFDPAARTLTCARAGHCPFIRIRSDVDGQRVEVLAPDGMVLGLNLDGGERFEQCLDEISIPLDPGDLICFYTDGISEAMDDGGEYFGEVRVAGLLERLAAHTPEVIRDALVEEISAFVRGQPQHDDITMIIVRVDG
jgi:serine phosphatase RsbU (regulator of sigma subunit)